MRRRPTRGRANRAAPDDLHHDYLDCPRPRGAASRPVLWVTAVESGGEGTGPVVFLFRRTGGDTSEDMIVHYEMEGDATEGADYPYMARKVIIPRGATTATLIIPIRDDDEIEPAEQITVRPLPPPTTRPALGPAATTTAAASTRPTR